MGETKFPTYREDLTKTFLEELNYKMWVTKGARFNANKRLLARNDWSNKAIGFLTAYLIIFGLLSVYQVSKTPLIDPNIVAFGSTAVSILLLAFSQMEFAADYKSRAKSYHTCALKVSKLYNELRIIKTMTQQSEEDREVRAREISDKYQSILNKYDNHEAPDYNKFRLDKWEYFELSKWQRFTTSCVYYFQTLLLYHGLIVVPPVIMLVIYIHALH